MNKNGNLIKAKKSKKDEFYTRYADIEQEMNAYLAFDDNLFTGKTVLCPCDNPNWSNFTAYFAENFEKIGLKKLVSTCYTKDGKGKIFRKTKQGEKLALLSSDGDFRSDEVRKLRDSADIIVTNPPFSLFREFIAWVMEGGKKFAVVGNKNCVTYKEVFPLIKANKLWSGNRKWAGGMWFETKHDDVDKVVDGVNMKNVPSIWVTNLEHGRRHEPLQLMTMEDNKRFNKRLDGKNAYEQYDNYNAIEVPFTQAIPSDFNGVMGVPISFLDKYNPEQFEILGIDTDVKDGILSSLAVDGWGGKIDRGYLNGKRMYSRLLIQFKKVA